MTVFGLIVGSILFASIAPMRSRWSPRQKVRFARGLKMRLFLPLAIGTIAFSLLVMMGWCLWHGGLTSKTSDLGSVVEFTSTAMLPLGAGLWTLLLARFSKKPQRKKLVKVERLLPIS